MGCKPIDLGIKKKRQVIFYGKNKSGKKSSWQDGGFLTVLSQTQGKAGTGQGASEHPQARRAHTRHSETTTATRQVVRGRIPLLGTACVSPYPHVLRPCPRHEGVGGGSLGGAWG